MSPTSKRMINYGLILLVIGAATIAIDWHSSTWLAAGSNIVVFSPII